MRSHKLVRAELEAFDRKLQGWAARPQDVAICKQNGEHWMLGEGASGQVRRRHMLLQLPNSLLIRPGTSCSRRWPVQSAAAPVGCSRQVVLL